MKTYLDIVCEINSHDEIRNLTPEEWAEEFDLAVRDYLDELYEVKSPDAFATEEHDATIARARKHRRALKKSKHDVPLMVQRKFDQEKALREKGFKSVPYHRERWYRDPLPFVQEAKRDFKERLAELDAPAEELTNIFSSTFAEYLDKIEAFRYVDCLDMENAYLVWEKLKSEREYLEDLSAGCYMWPEVDELDESDVISPEEMEQIWADFHAEREEYEKAFDEVAREHQRTLDKNRARRRSLKKEKRGGYHTGAQYKKESMFFHTRLDARTREEIRDFCAQIDELGDVIIDDQEELAETPIIKVEVELDPDDIEIMMNKKGREEKSSYDAGYEAGYEAGYRAAYAEMFRMTATKLQ